MRNKPATIALMADEYQEYRKLVVDQISRVLNEAGYGVICVIGKEIDPDPQFHQDYTVCNSIYSAVKEYNLAGLMILTGGLATNSSQQRVDSFVESYSHVPKASFGMILNGIPSVTLDDSSATVEMYKHLLELSACSTVAFVGGNPNDKYSQEREHIFRNIAKDNGYSEDAIVSIKGHYSSIETYDNVLSLLRKHLDIGVIAVANDLMAESAVRAVQASNLRVPEDILVTGFDDTQEATRVYPAMTTVRQPITEAAIQCAQLLLDNIHNQESHSKGKLAQRIELPAEFIERGSTAVKAAIPQDIDLGKATVVNELMQAMRGLEPPANINMDSLCEMLWTSIESSPIDIEKNLLHCFESTSPSLQSIHWWTNLCHQIEKICKTNGHNGRYSRTCTDVSGAVSAVRARIWDISMNNEFDKLRNNDVRTTMQLQMSSCVEESEILDTMGRWLRQTNIDRFYLVRYADPGPAPTDQAVLMYAYEKGAIDKRPATSFPSTQPLPDTYAHVTDNGLVVQAPVYAGNYLFGYLLLDPSGLDHLYLDSAAQSIGNALRNQHLIRQLEQQADHLKASNQELVKLANFDELTELPNRLQFNEYLTRTFNQTLNNGDCLTLLFIDLDGFKLVNDNLGHRSGDELLKTVAKRLKFAVSKAVGNRGFIARLGGDEFTVTLSSVKEAQQVEAISDAVLKSLSSPYTIFDHTINISASIGMAHFPSHTDSVEGLIKNADSAMYRAKEKGKNQAAWYTSDLSVFGDTLLQMDNDMREALESGDICMHYQPRVNMDTGLISAVEALMRWTIQTPEGCKVRTRPDVFIAIAEKTGFISKLDAFALNEACRQAREWELAGTPLLVAVNISVLHLQQDDFVRTVLKTLARHKLTPTLLELEITESAMMTQVEANVDKLHKLREHGIQLSIDDFGTGYSSLSYLKKLPVNNLKIDKSFISDIDPDRMRRSADAAIVKSVIALGRSMDFQIIAEGIETESQRQFLHSLGCHEAQGYLFARPSPASEITHLLDTSQTHKRSA